MTDSQKDLLYHSENKLIRLIDTNDQYAPVSVAGSTFSIPREAKFGDLASVQRYCDQVTKHFNLSPVTCLAMRKDARSKAYYRARQIHLPTVSGRWSMRELVVLHELAHHAARSENGSACEAHGSEFAGKFVEMVDWAMGTEASMMLKIFFYENGVKVG
jgi:putative metallohydrolase (TIGR04338 family)